MKNHPDKNFAVTRHAGFQVKFPNGYIVSVQFGPINYCENRDFNKFIATPDADGNVFSVDAETAVFHVETGEWVVPPWDAGHDTVQGWQSPEDMLRLMTWAASLPAPPKKTKNEEQA